MRKLYRSENKLTLLYEMDGELFIAQHVPNYPDEEVRIADEDLVGVIEAMMGYAEERGLIHRKWIPKKTDSG